MSPKLGVSGAGGEGTKMVFLTSLRPRLIVGLRGVTTCCIDMSAITDQRASRGLTARKVLATFERADCALSSSSLIGSFRMSSLNCGSVSLPLVSISLTAMAEVPPYDNEASSSVCELS